MNKTHFLLLALLSLASLAACSEKGPGGVELGSARAALPTMEHVALTANRCWFKSGNSDFKAYRLAPELKSFSGKPRILVVPYQDPGGRPLLVVEATGEPARVAAYGPLMQEKIGNRIADDLDRWTQGDGDC